MTSARSVPTASEEHAVPDRVERLMPELKADLIRMARIPSATFPESALGRIADAFETAGAKPAGFAALVQLEGFGRGAKCWRTRGAPRRIRCRGPDQSCPAGVRALGEREEIVAHVGDERAWLMLGLRGVPPDERARFIRLALLEAYLDPVSGDPLAWQALISALEVICHHAVHVI